VLAAVSAFDSHVEEGPLDAGSNTATAGSAGSSPALAHPSKSCHQAGHVRAESRAAAGE